MSKSLEKKQIVSFTPRPFPPRKLNRKSFAPQLLKAKSALREFRTSLKLAPSPQKTFFPFLAIEALDSLDSQQVRVPLKKFLSAPKKARAFAPINDYLEAFEWAAAEITKSHFSKKQICKIHKMIKRGSAPKPDLGCYRNRQNWIGPSGCTIDHAYFYPPASESVDRLMNQLLRYMKHSNEEPLLQLGLIFAQFLIIHPFMDGNGRVARILIPLFLYKKKVLPSPFFFLSGYFKYRRLKYFQTLFKTTEENNWDEWIDFFLRGIIVSARKHTFAFERIGILDERLGMQIPRMGRKPRDFLFQNPVFAMASFKKAKGSVADLRELIKLKLVKQGKDRQLCFVPLMKILQNLQKQ